MLLTAAACSNGESDREPDPADPPARNPRVQSIRPMHPFGARPRFAPNGASFVFDRLNSDGFYDLYVSDLSGRVTTNVTEGRAGITQRHNGNGIFHPGGRFIVFVSEEPEHFALQLPGLGDPGIGLFSNFWAFDVQTQAVRRLTNLPIKRGLLDPTPAMAAVNPVFSPNGETFVWTERYAEGGNHNWGLWRLKTARFTVDGNGIPSLQGERVLYTPSRGTYVTAMDFLDANRLLVAGNLDGQHEFGMDQYILELSSLSARNLTNTPQVWEEGACISPGGSIVFMSNRDSRAQLDFNDPDWPRQPVEREYYLIQPDGSGLERLTYFNDPAAPEETGRRTIVAACDFSPDGATFAGTQGLDQSSGGRADLQLRIILVGIAGQLRLTPRRAALDAPGSPSRESHLASAPIAGAPPAAPMWVAVGGDEVSRWEDVFDAMVREERLRLTAVVPDTVAAGREHEHYEQWEHGLPVFGAYVRREIDRRRPIAMHGLFYPSVARPRSAAVDAATAVRVALGAAGTVASLAAEPQLGILPGDRPRLAYRVPLQSPWGARFTFIDAATGEVLRERFDARGPWTLPAEEPARTPGDAATAGTAPVLDFRGDSARFSAFTTGRRAFPSDLGSPGDPLVAAVGDAVQRVDAYLRERFLRAGLDGKGAPLVVALRPLPSGRSFSDPPPARGGEAYYIGSGILTVQPPPAGGVSVFDAVARAAAYGVLEYTSRPAHDGESGAAALAFGELVSAGARQAADPAAAFGTAAMARPFDAGLADHTSIMRRDAWLARDAAAIIGHAFYLSVAGGTHRLSGVPVRGTGVAERARMERVFYRAMAYFLGPDATLLQVRRATLTAAAEAFGAESSAPRQLAGAWTAVGVVDEENR